MKAITKMLIHLYLNYALDTPPTNIQMRQPPQKLFINNPLVKWN